MNENMDDWDGTDFAERAMDYNDYEIRHSMRDDDDRRYAYDRTESLRLRGLI